jgi:hypothetical protein
MAMGDAPNDLGTLKLAGNAIAMDNALPPDQRHRPLDRPQQQRPGLRGAEAVRTVPVAGARYVTTLSTPGRLNEPH